MASNGTYRDALITVLGGKCSCEHTDCWHNGSCKVADRRCLQIDHINGDGNVDRRRFATGEAMFRHYLENLSSEECRVQVLCANCNWMKRLWNEELRQAEPYGDIAECIEGLDSYAVLLTSFRDIADSIVRADELTLLVELKRYGLAEATKHPLSYYLSRNWTRQDFYGDNTSSLVVFLDEKGLLLKSMGKRLAIRVRGSVGSKSR